MDEGSPQIVQLCTVAADGTRTCIEQAHGLLIWGSNLGSMEQGIGLVVGAFLCGVVVAQIRRVFFDRD